MPAIAREQRALVFGLLLCSGLSCAPQAGTIGAWLGRRDDGRLFLREVPPELAAGKAGLREGDEILLIDGADVRRMPAQDLRRVLAGNVGEDVKLTLIRSEEILRITLKRTPRPERTGRDDDRGPREPP